MIGLLWVSKGYIKFDNISINLAFRSIIFLLSSFLLIITNAIDTNFQVGILMTYFVCCIAYLFGKYIDKKFISAILFGCLIVILLQLIITYIGRGLSFNNIAELKWWMRIPIGQTNTIGCFVIGMMIYICSSDIKKIFRIIAYIISFVCIIFTGSRSGLIILGLYTIYRFIKYLYKNKNKMIMRSLIIVLSGVFLGLIFLLFNNNLLDRFNLDSMTSARIQVYAEGLKLFFQYPLTGVTAFSFHIYDAVKAHNWILESLIESGLIGSVFYFYAIYLAIKIIKKYNKKYLPFIFFYLLHGLVEPNLFTVSFDLFFWFLVGTLSIGEEVVYEKNFGNYSNISKD